MSLTRLWPWIAAGQGMRPRPVPGIVKRQLLECMLLLPLMAIDLRAPISSVATASDASEQGGGVCASIRLTQRGVQRVRQELGRTGATAWD